jgi:hypothetical protein
METTKSFTHFTVMVVNYKKVKTGKPSCTRLPKVDNLIATIDLNGKQIDGSTDEVLAGSIRAKFEADWDV